MQAPVAPSPQSHSGKSSPLFIRRDASVRPALNSGFSLDTRSEQPVSRSSSDARSAFLGTPGTKALGRRVAATNSSGSRGRKSFLSDDSSPESPLNAARGSVEASTSRFPSAVQLQNISRDATDEIDFSRRNEGMTSPIRRRENAGPGRTLRGTNPPILLSPKIATDSSVNYAMRAVELRADKAFGIGLYEFLIIF